MRKSLFIEEVLNSWRRCVENRLPMDAIPKGIETGYETFAELLSKHTLLISIYDKIINNIKLYMGKESHFLYYQMTIT